MLRDRSVAVFPKNLEGLGRAEVALGGMDSWVFLKVVSSFSRDSCRVKNHRRNVDIWQISEIIVDNLKAVLLQAVESILVDDILFIGIGDCLAKNCTVVVRSL